VGGGRTLPEDMPMSPNISAPVLLVENAAVLQAVVRELGRHQLSPRVAGEVAELLRLLKMEPEATVFLDCRALMQHGVGLIARLRVASPGSRLVLLCSRDHPHHQSLVREAMDMGVYACLSAPYQDYEILAMVRPAQSRKPPRKPPPRRDG